MVLRIVGHDAFSHHAYIENTFGKEVLFIATELTSLRSNQMPSQLGSERPFERSLSNAFLLCCATLIGRVSRCISQRATPPVFARSTRSDQFGNIRRVLAFTSFGTSPANRRSRGFAVSERSIDGDQPAGFSVGRPLLAVAPSVRQLFAASFVRDGQECPSYLRFAESNPVSRMVSLRCLGLCRSERVGSGRRHPRNLRRSCLNHRLGKRGLVSRHTGLFNAQQRRVLEEHLPSR